MDSISCGLKLVQVESTFESTFESTRDEQSRSQDL